MPAQRQSLGGLVSIQIIFAFFQREKVEEYAKEEDIQKINHGNNNERKQLRGITHLRFEIHGDHRNDNDGDDEDHGHR